MLKELVVKDDVTEVVAPVKSEVKFLGSLKPCKGHTLYELDLRTMLIVEAVFESINAGLNGAVRKKIVVRDNCLYASALNKQNADKKFHKMVGRKYKK